MKKGLPHPRNPGQIDTFLQRANYEANTVSLLHFNSSVDNSINIYDEIADKVWSVFGDSKIKTDQFVFGGSSGRFDGTGDYIQAETNGDFIFGTGDFTIDFRIRFSSLPAASTLLVDFRESSNGLFPTIFVDSTGKLIYFTNSSNRITGTTTLVTNTWYHIAVARSGTSTKAFLNGTQEGSTYTDSNNYSAGTNRPVVAARGLTPVTFYLNGWIDELRFMKGVAAWTSNFTPPASEYAPV